MRKWKKEKEKKKEEEEEEEEEAAARLFDFGFTDFAFGRLARGTMKEGFGADAAFTRVCNCSALALARFWIGYGGRVVVGMVRPPLPATHCTSRCSAVEAPTTENNLPTTAP